jgi:hypothetical protein
VYYVCLIFAREIKSETKVFNFTKKAMSFYKSKQMKKNLFTVLAVCVSVSAFSNMAKAQAGVTTASTGPVTVNVTLQDVIGVTLTGAVVNFVYDSPLKYNTDQNQLMTGQLTITSTKAFSLNVSASQDFTGSTLPTLPITILKVSAFPTTTAPGAGVSPTVTPAAAATVFSASPAILAGVFDVNYLIPRNLALLTATKQLYTTNLIYTVTAP